MPPRPPFTETFEVASDFRPPEGAIYVYGTTSEDRSQMVAGWPVTLSIELVHVTDEDSAEFRFVRAGRRDQVGLRSQSMLMDFWRFVSGRPVYLDVTGLSHHVWAPLLRAAIKLELDSRIVYVEPQSYKFNPAPTEGEIFDLSERISGVAPIPGFATLFDDRRPWWLVPLLGFEGTRLAHILEQTQPLAENIIPVVGVPGFRLEYPYHTYLGNRRALVESESWSKVRYAAANCPFELYAVLEQIQDSRPGHLLRLAPIGTKPHAIGAVVFKIFNDSSVELIYDYPIRTRDRTSGTDKLHVYHVVGFS